jgi:H+/Cl- antiporter ClcA
VFTPPLSLTFLILSAAFIGMIVGALTGFLASLILRLKIRFRDILTDGILGLLGFPLAFEVVLLIPWRNTITYHVGDTLVTSTMNHYQHPDLVAYSTAILLPVLHELYRFKTTRNAGTPLSPLK